MSFKIYIVCLVFFTIVEADKDCSIKLIDFPNQSQSDLFHAWGADALIGHYKTKIEFRMPDLLFTIDKNLPVHHYKPNDSKKDTIDSFGTFDLNAENVGVVIRVNNENEFPYIRDRMQFEKNAKYEFKIGNFVILNKAVAKYTTKGSNDNLTADEKRLCLGKKVCLYIQFTYDSSSQAVLHLRRNRVI